MNSIDNYLDDFSKVETFDIRLDNADVPQVYASGNWLFEHADEILDNPNLVAPKEAYFTDTDVIPDLDEYLGETKAPKHEAKPRKKSIERDNDNFSVFKEPVLSYLASKLKRSGHNTAYLIWFGLYYLMFVTIFGGSDTAFLTFGFIYGISFLVCISPLGEWIMRKRTGIRPMRTAKEINTLGSILEDLYDEAERIDPLIYPAIEIFIDESMDVNAYAFGRKTLVVTKGSLELLSESDLHGLIAHEFGHFSGLDTLSIVLASIGNVSLSVLCGILQGTLNLVGRIFPNEGKSFLVRILKGILSLLYKVISFVTNLFLMSASRTCEYKADKFAFECGYGEEMLNVLKQFEMLETGGNRSFTALLMSTHPDTSNRIKRLEKLLGY